jgi:type IV pilus assembly protein PilP
MSLLKARYVRRTSALLLAACVGLGALGCGDSAESEALTFKPPKGSAPVKPAKKPAGKGGATPAPPPSNLPPLPLRTFEESDFAESDKSRDPFRSYENLFVKQAKTRSTLQRQVLVERYALDELHLTGIVTRGSARALLVDPTGLGWIVQTGDYVGKAEIVRSGGASGVDVAVNWRVDRIRDSDVVFVREDPSRPEIPPTTRVIALRAAEDTGAAQTPTR